MNTNRTLELQADKLWSESQHLIWGDTCAKCGCPGGDPHHLIKRRIKATRHCMMNGVLLCKICHRLAEDKQERFLKWLRYEHWDRWVWQHENKSPKTMGALAYKGELVKTIESLKWFNDNWEGV